MSTLKRRVKNFRCMECDRTLTLRQAEQAVYGSSGCPGCGSVDIDINLDVWNQTPDRNKL